MQSTKPQATEPRAEAASPNRAAPHRTLSPAEARRSQRRLFRLLFANLVLGALAGAAFVAIAVAQDFGGLGAAVSTARGGDGALALALLFGGVMATWGSAAMGTAVFLDARREEDTPSGGSRAPSTAWPRRRPTVQAAPAAGRTSPAGPIRLR